jgi:DNA-binding Lrp family transcriptional regulator
VLDVLGISEFDEQVYRVFLARPDHAVVDIAASVNAAPTRVRHAVARLEKLGLVRRVAHGRYQPMGPQPALMAVLNQRRAEAEAAFARAQGAVADLAEEYRAGRLRTDPSSLVEVLSGRDTVLPRVQELSRSISTHMWVLDKPPYLEYPNGWMGSNELEIQDTVAMLERGVDVRSVYCPESMERPGRFETVLHLAGVGEQSRMLPSLPFKLHILDRRVAFVPLVGGVYESMAVVHPSGLLDALLELYEAYWARAEPILGNDDTADDTQPGPDDLLLLRMLKAGLKDHAVARQLGISSRTATRRIATIMASLGADTRFQAGVEAAKRGWL